MTERRVARAPDDEGEPDQAGRQPDAQAQEHDHGFERGEELVPGVEGRDAAARGVHGAAHPACPHGHRARRMGPGDDQSTDQVVEVTEYQSGAADTDDPFEEGHGDEIGDEISAESGPARCPGTGSPCRPG